MALHAQQLPYTFRHLNIQQGLAGNHVSAILQDRRGFLWIASTALQRYDGSNFNTVANFDRLPGSVFYDDICLVEDNANRIWIGSPQNVRRYDPVTGKVSVVPLSFKPTSLRELQCEQMICDHNGVIWATSEEGLLVYNSDKDQMERASMVPENIRCQMNSGIIEDASGNIWISGRNGIFMLDHQRKTLYSKDYNPGHIPVLNLETSVRKFYRDHTGRMWIAARTNVVYCYTAMQLRMDSVLLYAPEANQGKGAYARAFDAMEDNAGTVWLATEGVGMYGVPSGTMQASLRILGNNNDEQGLYYNDEINCFFRSDDGQLWVGTDYGISIMSLQTPELKIWSYRTSFSGTPLRLPKSEVTDLLQTPDSDIYIAYWGGGVYRLDAGMHPKQVMEYGNNAAVNLPNHQSKVWSLAAFQGKVLIGQENGELSVFNPRTNNFEVHYHPAELDNEALLDIFPDNDTAVWIGLYKKGLARWNPRLQRFYNCDLSAYNTGALSVMDMIREGNDRLWLATNDAGLLLWDKRKGGVIKNVLFKNADSSVVNNVLCLYRCNDTTLLAGTDHGLFIYNTLRNAYTQLQAGENAFDEWVLSMQGRNGAVWLTTTYGFYRYNPSTQELEIFQQNDDIIDNARKTRRRILPLQDGRLLVGASNFVVSLLPATLQPAPPPPDVTITGLRAMDSTMLFEAALTAGGAVKLTAHQNFITISFRSIHFNRGRVRYYYKLEGLDEDWTLNNLSTTARYTNLSPGFYTFKVKALNTAGTFSDHITILRIYVKPAFWQTWWFKVLCAIAILVAIFSFMRFRIRRVQREARRRAEFQQQISQLEMKALRAQMNPHFIFNALNSIQIFMMKNQPELALAYLGRFARLIRDVLDHSQLNTLPLSKELKMLENYMELEKLRFADQFSYNITISPELELDFIEIPSMILQPFVENAIWHGLLHKKAQGTLHITFEQKGERLLCIIKDDGIGRDRSAAIKQQNGQTHHSRGLQITRDRLSLYNSRFDMDASFEIIDLKTTLGEPLGTQVNIWIPLEK
ncbi:sensor histidine kinase [Chitinophaga parva]|uniref:sensor histidine kinase n=1 Tax=Chitinophaga parva TaxID=2169414 RepID=UPI00140219A1|nr:two-component regulator propeller domain-containing protein [Chitinophaga parva]